MRHAERAQLSHRPAVCSTPDQAWVIIALAQSSVARCGDPLLSAVEHVAVVLHGDKPHEASHPGEVLGFGDLAGVHR